MSEYYIRKEGDEDASGPFDLDQLTSLIEAGKLDQSAYFYDIDSEEWQAISSNQDLMSLIYPEKRKLKLRHSAGPSEVASDEKAEPPPIPSSNPEPTSEDAPEIEGKAAGAESEGPSDDEPPQEEVSEDKVPHRSPKLFKKEEKKEEPKSISIEAMLAQAEGREGDDLKGKSPTEKKEFAAYFGLRSLTALCFLSATMLGVIELELLKTANVMLYIRNPFVIVGFFDFLFGLALLLQVTAVYPLIRFRAAIGLPLLSILFYGSGDHFLILANVLVSVSLYLCTAAINTPKAIISAAIGFTGIGIYGYILIAAQYLTSAS